MNAIVQAEGFATPADEATAVEVGDEVKGVADGAFDERDEMFAHDLLQIRQGMKQRATLTG